MCKVEFHIIDILDAPDAFQWECNNYVDEAATKARLEFHLEDLIQQKDFLFPGVKVGCKIAGRIEKNTLYETLYTCANSKWNT